MEIYRYIAVVLMLLYVTEACSWIEAERYGRQLADEFEQYYESGQESPQLKQLVQRFSLPEITDWIPLPDPYSSTICTLCYATANAILKYYYARKTPNEIQKLIEAMCITFKISTPNVCHGAISINLEPILYIINNTEYLTASRICGVVFQSYQCAPYDPSLEWTVDIDMGPKPESSVNSAVRYKGASENIQVIQLTDIHYEPTYEVNGNAECGEPMCCRSSQGNATDPSNNSGYWGDYRKCDLPWHSIQNLLHHVKTAHKNADYIYMTGDIVDHAVWDTSPEKNTKAITKFMKELSSLFGDKPLFPILGNHEPNPVNVFAPLHIKQKNLSTHWLFELVADLWSPWLPAEAKDTILRGGFYSVLVKPGFRIIALNNNVCYTFNWWLLYDPKDPYDQLKWLAETLATSEKNGEKVHILGHVPPGDSSCLKTWSREYQKIIDRFENTVTAQFNGHTHYDEFEISYSSTSKNTANGLAFNGGSATPYEHLNPNYKVYHMNPESMAVVDFETWIFNLTEANLNKNAPPNWYKLYTCQDAYGINSLSPESMHNLAYKMAKENTMLQKYHRYFVKNADPLLQKGCDTECQKRYLCQMVTTNTADNTQCKKIQEEFGEDK